MKKLKISFLVSSILFLFSCQKNQRAGIDPESDLKAAQNIQASFQIVNLQKKISLQPTSDLQVVDKAHVAVAKSALNKEFLLSTNLLTQTPTPMFSSLQSRVVSFVLRDQKLYMLDVTKNNQVGIDNISQSLLLAEFSIFSEDKFFVVIDFNNAMKKIFNVSDMTGSDDSSSIGADYKLPTAQVSLSYLDEVSFANEALFIRQIAQVEVTKDDATEIQPVEVRYQIKPYSPDPTFVPTISPGFEKVGYFEANPLLLKDGSTRIYAMKWNTAKPIQFAISANTPEKYRDLVKEALLYWNKILGAGAIQVTQLTDKNMTAPQFDASIIQWADWDAAGYAYADAHIDPRSGEVTSAQIFIPTAFTQANVPKRIRLSEGSRPIIGLKGFNSARLCQRDVLKDIVNREIAAASPEAMDKAMRDYVYEVIAHEMGHVMGLRHNFAGNLAGNYDFKDRKALIQSYYKDMKAPAGIVNSSSVMEYSRFEESSWNGDQFRNNGNALAYDQMAIEHLYLNKDIPSVRPIFCTDSQIDKYADCNMSDEGRSIVSGSSGMYQFNLDSLAARLVNLYISKSKLADDPGLDLIPVREVDLNAKNLVKTLGVDLAKLVSLLKKETKLIAVRSALLPVLSTDQGVQQLEKNYLQNEFNRLGGLATLTQALPNDFSEKLSAKFNELIENPDYNSGVTEQGKIYEFTIDEKEWMKQQVALFATQMKEQLILNEIKALSGESFSFEVTYGQKAPADKLGWADSVLSNEFAPILLNRFKQYALSASANKLQSEVPMKDGSLQKVELPIYSYPQNIRLASAQLLSNGHEAIEWAYVEKNEMSDLFKKETLLFGDEDKVELNRINKDILKWLLNNKQIESALPN